MMGILGIGSAEIGNLRTSKGIEIVLLRGTRVLFRLLMEPETPLLAILLYAIDLDLFYVDLGMPEFVFTTRPAFRLEVRSAV